MKTLRRIAIVLTACAGVAAAVLLAAAWRIGAWHILFPSHAHDAVPPALPAELARPAILVFTKTNSFRHREAIPAGAALFEQIAARRGWGFFQTENGAVFGDESLARFDAVVFHNASGDTLDDAQERAFQRWLESGGGWVGTHAAGDGSHRGWRWYQETLIGAPFTAHTLGPHFQTARIRVEDPEHPAAAALPRELVHLEEWYSWEASVRPRGFHVIATVDEASYQPFARMFGFERDLRMGDHPIVWSRCVGRGRALYSALGHRAEAYADPHHAALLEGALAWVTGSEGAGCE